MSEHVRLMFSDISESYDLGNDILSFGTHRLWKRKFVRMLDPRPADRVLDIASGTGDIARLFAQKVGTDGEVVGVDFSAAMVSRARKRARNMMPNLRFEVGDGLDLRFPSNSFDIATNSFGIRNVDDTAKGIAEMARVVKPGGKVGILEFGQPVGIWSVFFKVYSRNVLPFVGGIISGNQEAYSYLDKTAAAFPCGTRFAALMEENGLADIRFVPLLGGTAWIYIGHVR